jgi:hypothetical protein
MRVWKMVSDLLFIRTIETTTIQHPIDERTTHMKTINAAIRWPLLAVMLVVVGCATAPQPDPRSTPSAIPPEGSGRIIFYRPSGLLGYGMRSDILLDGKKVGQSAPGTKFYVDTAPAIHYIAVPNSLYSGDRTLDVTVQNKEIIFVRTSIGGSAFGGRTNVELIGASQGAQEAASLELVNY